MTKEKKEMEYEDAPSGYVTLYNYKEPFMKYESGYGYQGVLLYDGLNDQIQCHLCGGWFNSLGSHLHREHNTSAYEYKAEVGLTQNASLISEAIRSKLIKAAKKRKNEGIKPHLHKHRKSSIAKMRLAIKDNANRREAQNKRGTCPEQLLDRMQKDYQRLGRTPTEREAGYYPTVKKTYGTWRHACELAGIPYRTPGKKKKSIEKEQVLRLLKKFKKDFDRNPSQSDCTRGYVPTYRTICYYFGNLSEAIKLI